MSKKMQRVLGVLICLLVFALCLVLMSGATRKRNDQLRHMSFYTWGEQSDVLFFGTSHMVDAVLPMEIWDEYGITTFNRGIYGAPLPIDYWALINSLDYSSPELVVLDCYRLSNEEKVGGSGHMHYLFDNLPLSRNKVRAVFDMYGFEDMKSTMGMLWPFSTYHSRWNELSDYVDGPETKIQLGGQHVVNVEIAEPPHASKEKLELSEDMDGLKYLRMFIEECQRREIEVLLIYLPFPAGEEEAKEANAIYDIAAEYSLNYINFLDTQVIDYHTDMFDSFSHLNASGARKISDYLGKYVAENYELSDHREDADYAAWDENLVPYREYKMSLLEKEEILRNYLMLLRDDDLSLLIHIPEGSEIFSDEWYLRLIENIPTDKVSLSKLRQAAAMGQAYTLIVDNTDGAVLEFTAEEDVSDISTGFGRISLSDESITIDGQSFSPVNEDMSSPGDISICVFNKHVSQETPIFRSFNASVNIDYSLVK